MARLFLLWKLTGAKLNFESMFQQERNQMGGRGKILHARSAAPEGRRGGEAYPPVHPLLIGSEKVNVIHSVLITTICFLDLV